jgi:hypothetical protein
MLGVPEIVWLALIPEHQTALDPVVATQPLVDSSLVSARGGRAANAAIAAVGEEVDVGVGSGHAVG